MSYKVMVSGNYATHLAPLIRAMNKTSGDVLELGVGHFSTPYLHYQCLVDKRHLTSYENERSWIKRFAAHPFYAHMYQGKYHDLIYVPSWDEAKIEKSWDVALVDHSPSERRITEIKRLADYAKYIVVHDTNEGNERTYHFSEIYPLFKYRTIWDGDANQATVLSNLIDLKDFWG